MTDPKHEELVLDGIVSNPQPPFEKKLCLQNFNLKIYFIELMSLILSDVCFPIESAIFVRKTVF